MLSCVYYDDSTKKKNEGLEKVSAEDQVEAVGGKNRIGGGLVRVIRVFWRGYARITLVAVKFTLCSWDEDGESSLEWSIAN